MLRIMIFLVSLSLLLSACNRTNQAVPNQPAPNQGTANQGAATPGTTHGTAYQGNVHRHNAPGGAQVQRAPQTAPQPAYNESPQAKADRLVQLATRVKKVKGATAVVLGNMSVVGISIDPALDRPDVGVIKYSVAEALKHDPQGATAIVTADPGIVQRLREMSEDIRGGRPLMGITEELADIVGRIIPQMPQSVRNKESLPSNQRHEKLNKTSNPSQPNRSGVEYNKINR